MKMILEQLIETYINQGKDGLDKKFRMIKRSRSSESMLKHLGRAKSSIEVFLKKEKGILPRISRCTCWEDVEEFAYSAFSGIKGIGNAAIDAWVWKQVDLLDLDREASCFSCLNAKLREELKKKGVNEQQLVRNIKGLHKDFESYSNLDVANFISYTSKKKMLNDILPKSTLNG